MSTDESKCNIESPEVGDFSSETSRKNHEDYEQEEGPHGYAFVKLVGNLTSSFPNRKTKLSNSLIVRTPLTLGNLLSDISQKYAVEFRRENILILVNGVEAGALQDLQTFILARDEVVLIPMFHGGLLD